MILNPFKLYRLLQETVAALGQANQTTRGAIELAQKWEALCERQAGQIADLTFKNECLMRGIDPLVVNRSTDHFELKPPQYVN